MTMTRQEVLLGELEPLDELTDEEKEHRFDAAELEREIWRLRRERL